MTHPGGRPSKYDRERHPVLARQLTGEGKTLADLAQLFEVNRDTIVEWKKNHVEFSVAVLAGREDATDKVERALYERATGYVAPVEKILVVDGAIERVATTEHYPPETNAAKLWLLNMRGQGWKEKQEVQHTGSIVGGVMLIPSVANMAEWAQLVEQSKVKNIEAAKDAPCG